MKRYAEIKVLVEETYLVEMIDEEKTVINGWSLETVKREWFERFSINAHHATRDTHLLGGGRRVVSVKSEM